MSKTFFRVLKLSLYRSTILLENDEEEVNIRCKNQNAALKQMIILKNIFISNHESCDSHVSETGIGAWIFSVGDFFWYVLFARVDVLEDLDWNQ